MWPINVHQRLLKATFEFLWWVVGGIFGLHRHFRDQPNNSVEVVFWLCCVVVWVVTKIIIVEKRYKQAGAELCQALQSLSYLLAGS